MGSPTFPCRLLTTTTRPLPLASMEGSSAEERGWGQATGQGSEVTADTLPLVSATVPKKLTSMTFRSTARSVSIATPLELIPALLTRMSTWPNTARASCAAEAMEAGEERSSWTTAGGWWAGQDGWREGE